MIYLYAATCGKCRHEYSRDRLNRFEPDGALLCVKCWEDAGEPPLYASEPPLDYGEAPEGERSKGGRR